MSAPISISGGCCRCKEPMWMSAEAYATYKRNGQAFYCIHGHGQVFTEGESEANQIRRERDRLKQQLAQKDDELKMAWATANDQHEKAKHERARANGYKGHATRITMRAKAGVCPCCNRTFQQLARHMAAKHPQFTPMPLEVIDGGKAA